MSSMVLDGASPRSRRKDPVTSVDAGRAANLPGSQAIVLMMLDVHQPCTQAVLESVAPGYSPSRIRSAVSELREMGLVRPSEGYGKTRYGRRAQLWERAS